jgi:hypothetical protein
VMDVDPTLAIALIFGFSAVLTAVLIKFLK